MVITAADRAAFFRENPNKRAASPGEIQQWVNARIAVATAVANNNQSAVRGKVPDWFNQLDAQNSSMTPQARGVLIRALQDIEPKGSSLEEGRIQIDPRFVQSGATLASSVAINPDLRGYQKTFKGTQPEYGKGIQNYFPQRRGVGEFTSRRVQQELAGGDMTFPTLIDARLAESPAFREDMRLDSINDSTLAQSKKDALVQLSTQLQRSRDPVATARIQQQIASTKASIDNITENATAGKILQEKYLGIVPQFDPSIRPKFGDKSERDFEGFRGYALEPKTPNVYSRMMGLSMPDLVAVPIASDPGLITDSGSGQVEPISARAQMLRDRIIDKLNPQQMERLSSKFPAKVTASEGLVRLPVMSDPEQEIIRARNIMAGNPLRNADFGQGEIGNRLAIAQGSLIPRNPVTQTVFDYYTPSFPYSGIERDVNYPRYISGVGEPGQVVQGSQNLEEVLGDVNEAIAKGGRGRQGTEEMVMRPSVASVYDADIFDPQTVYTDFRNKGLDHGSALAMAKKATYDRNEQGTTGNFAFTATTGQKDRLGSEEKDFIDRIRSQDAGLGEQIESGQSRITNSVLERFGLSGTQAGPADNAVMTPTSVIDRALGRVEPSGKEVNLFAEVTPPKVMGISNPDAVEYSYQDQERSRGLLDGAKAQYENALGNVVSQFDMTSGGITGSRSSLMDAERSMGDSLDSVIKLQRIAGGQNLGSTIAREAERIGLPLAQPIEPPAQRLSNTIKLDNAMQQLSVLRSQGQEYWTPTEQLKQDPRVVALRQQFEKRSNLQSDINQLHQSNLDAKIQSGDAFKGAMMRMAEIESTKAPTPRPASRPISLTRLEEMKAEAAKAGQPMPDIKAPVVGAGQYAIGSRVRTAAPSLRERAAALARSKGLGDLVVGPSVGRVEPAYDVDAPSMAAEAPAQMISNVIMETDTDPLTKWAKRSNLGEPALKISADSLHINRPGAKTPLPDLSGFGIYRGGRRIR